MILDDGDLARLARIERQLASEAPELAEALHRWRLPTGRGSSWVGWLFLVAGIVFAVVAVLLASTGWALLAAAASVPGWWLRTTRGRGVLGGPGEA